MAVISGKMIETGVDVPTIIESLISAFIHRGKNSTRPETQHPKDEVEGYRMEASNKVLEDLSVR